MIEIDHLPPNFSESTEAPAAIAPNTVTVTATSPSENDVDEQVILDALKQARWVKTKAAQILGMSRNTLYRKLKQFNID